jgi:hypothetical protein
MKIVIPIKKNKGAVGADPYSRKRSYYPRRGGFWKSNLDPYDKYLMLSGNLQRIPVEEPTIGLGFRIVKKK